MSLEALFFDVGHTLLRESPPRFAIYAESARSRGRQITTKTMERMVRSAHDELPRRIGSAYRYSDPWFRAYIHRIFGQNLGLPPAEVANVTEELFARFEDAATFHVYPGAIELLEHLARRGVRLGVISNWSERLPRVLEALGLTRYFEEVLCSATEGHEKPAPELFAAALARLDVRAELALHVGDHPRNDGAAAQLGIQVVLIDHAGFRPESEHQTVGSFDELRVVLDRRIGP